MSDERTSEGTTKTRWILWTVACSQGEMLPATPRECSPEKQAARDGRRHPSN